MLLSLLDIYGKRFDLLPELDEALRRASSGPRTNAQARDTAPRDTSTTTGDGDRPETTEGTPTA
jgi:hypothetical protein